MAMDGAGHAHGHPVTDGLVVGGSIVTIVSSWAQSLTMGAISSAIGLLGMAYLFYFQKMVPARVAARQLSEETELKIQQASVMARLAMEQAEEAARQAKESGRNDELLHSIAQLQDRLDAERELAATADQRADHLAKMLDEMRAEAKETNVQLEKLRLTAHESVNKLEAAEKRSTLAVAEIHKIFERSAQAGDNLEAIRLAILGVLTQTDQNAALVVEKMDQVAVKVDRNMMAITQSNSGD